MEKQIRVLATLFYVMAVTGCSPTWTERTRAQDKYYYVDGRKERRIVYRDNKKLDAPLTLLFVHGLGSMKATWNAVSPRYEDDYRVVRMDLLGHGDSSMPDSPVYSPAHQGAILRQFIAANDLQNVVLVGVSYGAVSSLEAVAPLFAHGNAGQIKGLVLIGPPAFYSLPPDMKFFEKPLPYPFRPILEGTLSALLRIANDYAPSPSLYVRQAILHPAYSDHSRIKPDLAGEYSRIYLRVDARIALRLAFVQLFEERRDKADLDEAYRVIDCPTTVLLGAYDELVPLWVVTKLASETNSTQPDDPVGKVLDPVLPCATLTVVPNCGHALQEECPETVINAIDELIVRIREGAGCRSSQKQSTQLSTSPSKPPSCYCLVPLADNSSNQGASAAMGAIEPVQLTVGQ